MYLGWRFEAQRGGVYVHVRQFFIHIQSQLPSAKFVTRDLIFVILAIFSKIQNNFWYIQSFNKCNNRLYNNFFIFSGKACMLSRLQCFVAFQTVRCVFKHLKINVRALGSCIKNRSLISMLCQSFSIIFLMLNIFSLFFAFQIKKVYTNVPSLQFVCVCLHCGIQVILLVVQLLALVGVWSDNDYYHECEGMWFVTMIVMLF
eukprot:TRINITY_DN7957_c1_g1_i1.p3 TRINITY_DN7957_c1_g1~~TRINITY_DN7957_c1_g1_i1.p3  ORF type:complete len:202 (+),score=-17.22 TRINITY_DN7957_c1_g1_i1:891-1496(+)